MLKTGDLKKFPVFEKLRDKTLEKIVNACSISTYQAGEKVLSEGQQAGKLYLILRGRVVIERRLPVSWVDQKEGIVRYLNGNEIFGWSALMDSKTYTVTARCLENTEFIEIDGRKLLEILDSDHESGYMFMRDLASIIDRRLTSTSEYLMKHIAEIETERAM